MSLLTCFQTFRKVQEDPGDEHATEGHLRSRSHENIESKKGHPLNEGNVPKEKQKEFPGTEEIVEARSQIGFRGEGDAGVPNEHKHVDFAAESRTQSPSSNSKYVFSCNKFWFSRGMNRIWNVGHKDHSHVFQF